MKVFIAFLIASFVAGGLRSSGRKMVRNPRLVWMACAVCAASFLSLRIVL